MLLAPGKGWKKGLGKPDKNSMKPEIKHAFAEHSAGVVSGAGHSVTGRAVAEPGTSGTLTKRALAI